jgi:hypothetical protein
MSGISTNDVIIPIITAVIGGVLAGVPSYIGFRVKKLELEHAYKVSLENRFYEKSIEQLDTLYKPIYSLLNSYESAYQIEGDNLREIYKDLLERCKLVLEKDERMFMPVVIETELLAMSRFLTDSLRKNKLIVGVKQNVEIFGFASSNYNEEEFKDEWKAKRRVAMLEIVNIMSSVSSFFTGFLSSSLPKNEFEVYYKSTEVGSELFYRQMNKHTQTLKKQIKSIMVGDLG